MPSSGVPDYCRASCIVLRDYVGGNLLYCHCLQVLSDDDKKWESQFHHKTLAIQRQKKLREKSGVVETSDGEFLANNKSSGKKVDENREVDALENDLEMFEMMDMIGTPNSGKSGKSHKSRQKWGKKGHEQRNKDPYGCHDDPDKEMLSKSNAGLIVNAGKVRKFIVLVHEEDEL